MNTKMPNLIVPGQYMTDGNGDCLAQKFLAIMHAMTNFIQCIFPENFVFQDNDHNKLFGSSIEKCINHPNTEYVGTNTFKGFTGGH
eukprot:11697330-Ditylum_brightwellii.AAC.1